MPFLFAAAGSDMTDMMTINDKRTSYRCKYHFVSFDSGAIS